MRAGSYLVEANELNPPIEMATGIPPARHPSIEVRRRASGRRPLTPQPDKIGRLFRRLEGDRRIFSRFEKLPYLLGFISFVLVADGPLMC